jgi:hypothetical protein
MITVIFLAVGALVVVGVVYLVVAKGQAGGRHAQSSKAVVTAQRQEGVRANSVRASGGDD